LRLKSLTITVITCLLLFCIGCTKNQEKPTVKPFENISSDLVKRVEFDNLRLASGEKEIARSKLITKSQDIQTMMKYIKSLSCIQSSEKDKAPDFVIALISNTEESKEYLYSINIYKNIIYVYKFSGTNTIKAVYKCTDPKLIDDLKNLYSSMSYKEEPVMQK
jgi:hypothetical protein